MEDNKCLYVPVRALALVIVMKDMYIMVCQGLQQSD